MRLIKYIATKAVRPLFLFYLSSQRSYRYKNINLTVFSGVFHPGLFFSTKFLLQYLQTIDLKNKLFLELGAGSGLISIYACKQGASVTASDISHKAIENIKINQQKNNCSFDVICSDLFDTIPSQKIDIIAINPPYYKKNPLSEQEHAWYCGENMEYFKRLFSAIKNYFHSRLKVLMVISDECDLEEVKEIALDNNLKLVTIAVKKNWSETLFIYELKQV